MDGINFHHVNNIKIARIVKGRTDSGNDYRFKEIIITKSDKTETRITIFLDD